MFDPKTKITDRLTDAADLFIDFATLGEYGLEPVGRARQGCADLPRASHRPPATRATARTARCGATGPQTTLLRESGLFQSRMRTRAGQPV